MIGSPGDSSGEQSSDEEMDCQDKLFSSPGASGAYAGDRPLPKAGCFSPEGPASGVSGASAAGRSRPILTPEQTASAARPLPKFTPTPCKGTPMGPRSSIRTPMGPYSSGIAGAAGAFDCTPVNQRPTNAEITGGLTKDEVGLTKDVIFFDFDGVLSPVGLVSDREDFNLERIDRVDGLNKVLFENGIKARREKLMILKQQYSLCICSQNIHGNIVTFCNKYYLDFFDVIIGKKKGRDKIIKQDEMLKVLGGRRALFIDDDPDEIGAITRRDITARKITQWKLDSQPGDLPVVSVRPVEPVELKLRF